MSHTPRRRVGKQAAVPSAFAKTIPSLSMVTKACDRPCSSHSFLPAASASATVSIGAPTARPVSVRLGVTAVAPANRVHSPVPGGSARTGRPAAFAAAITPAATRSVKTPLP